MPDRAMKVLQAADEHCGKIVTSTSEIVAQFLRDREIPEGGLSFIAVGSIGRREALGASDLDLIPIAADQQALVTYKPFDKDLRKALQENLGLKVSKGEDLTSPADLASLVDPESIGGEKDDSAMLTKRLLILTEGIQVGGAFDLMDIKGQIIGAYSDQERTSGKHALSLCNDISRYYRTLCIEYKAKIDVEDKDWCTRNIKLRHSRKFWYFSNVVSIVTRAYKEPKPSNLREGLLEVLELPPYQRLFGALRKTQYHDGGTLLEHYAWFLRFMSKPDNRKALAEIQFEDRYADENGPYYAMKVNSDMMHMLMKKLFFGFDNYRKEKILDWFLL